MHVLHREAVKQFGRGALQEELFEHSAFMVIFLKGINERGCGERSLQ